MPSGVVSIASTLAVEYGVLFTSNRWAWVIACCISGILGGGLLSSAAHSHAAQLAGIYFVNTISAVLIIVYQWTVSKVARTAKRVTSVALIAGSFGVGNIVGPQNFQARDAPQYIPAKTAVPAMQSAAALVAFVFYLYYIWANKRRDAAVPFSGTTRVESQREQDLWEDQTHKQNPTYRYVY